MCEEYYVLVEKNDEEKFIEVKKQTFAFGSEEARQASSNQNKIFADAHSSQYKIVFKGVVLYDPELEKQKEAEKDAYIKRVTKEKEEVDKRLSEIKEKDLLELTEEEIVLLAQSRVHGQRTVRLFGQICLEAATTFESEYKKITDRIEQKKNSSSMPRR